MINNDGWNKYSVWEHSAALADLYTRRCNREAEEMTAHAQAAELLALEVQPGDTVLDVGCGSGYFVHSLIDRLIPAKYFGIDASRTLVDIGRRYLPEYGVPAERLTQMRIEDLDGEVDHVVCLNVLSNLDNFYRPLERILRVARKSVIIRDSLRDGAQYQYVRDDYLNDGIDLNVHVNHYDLEEFTDFIRSFGFAVDVIVDRRTSGQPEMVIGYPHHWTFVVARRL